MQLQVAAATSLHLSQRSVPPTRWCSFSGGDGSLFCCYSDRSMLLCSARRSSKLHRSRSFEKTINGTIRRALSSSSWDSFSDEEFARRIEEIALRFDDEDFKDDEPEKTAASFSCEGKFQDHLKPFDGLETPEFPERVEIIPANMEAKVNSVEIPFSLRMIRRKRQWDKGFMQAGETVYCSVKKAFSSMVFIIRELHKFTLQMREIEDIQGILSIVQKEIHASFVWLFQKVFPHTPTLMVYVMILLANYSVYSISSTAAIAAIFPVRGIEEVSNVEDERYIIQKFDSTGKTSSIGGDGGGGGKFRPVCCSTDGDGRFDESSDVTAGISSEEFSFRNNNDNGSNVSRTLSEESVSCSYEEEEKLWKSLVEEASKMVAESRDEALDQETMQRFVSPVFAKIESDEDSEYFRTQVIYQMELAQEPNNSLLLANYAQFLYLVAQDFDRSEEYFKRATKIEPKDAEASNKYANFLWKMRNDLKAAEERFLEAIDAEPENSFYTGDYANFLWITGGGDTCYPFR